MRLITRTTTLCALFAACFIAPRGVSATSIQLGTADGGVAIYYNDNGNGEVPSNQAYLRAQFSMTNTNGAEYNFDTAPLPGTNGMLSWFDIFQSVPDQFGLDAIIEAPTSDNTVPTPSLHAFENVDGSIANRTDAGPVTWAINGYSGASAGPADPTNQIINSLFRGGTGANDNITFSVTPVMVSGTLYTVTVTGELQSDNLIHWYNPSTPNSPVSNFELTGKLFFSGTLTYDSSTDTSTNLIDFYAGTFDIDAEVICAPRYVNQATGQDFPGGNPNTCRNPNNPCKTVEHAVEVSCPGDAVNVASGINLTKIRIRRQSSTGSNNGSIRGKGDFFTPPAFTSGIALRVQDAISLDETHTFTSCTTIAGRIRCSDTTPTGRFKADFRPLKSTPSIYRFKFSFVRLGIDSPFGAPVQVTLSHDGGINRIDTISDCRQSNSGLGCREF